MHHNNAWEITRESDGRISRDVEIALSPRLGINLRRGVKTRGFIENFTKRKQPVHNVRAQNFEQFMYLFSYCDTLVENWDDHLANVQIDLYF